MNNKEFIKGLKQQGFISGVECGNVVLDFLNTYEDTGGKIADWYDIRAIYPKVFRDVQKMCRAVQVGEGKGKRYYYKRDEVLEYLQRLDW